MMTFDRAEQFRIRKSVAHLPSTNPGDPYGMFITGIPGKSQIRMMANDGAETGWDHVSVSKLVQRNGEAQPVTPSWEDMCKVKDLFWDKEDCVVQFHPPASEYVNTHNNCLHLWRKVGPNLETPPKLCV